MSSFTKMGLIRSWVLYQLFAALAALMTATRGATFLSDEWQDEDINLAFADEDANVTTKVESTESVGSTTKGSGGFWEDKNALKTLMISLGVVSLVFLLYCCLFCCCFMCEKRKKRPPPAKAAAGKEKEEEEEEVEEEEEPEKSKKSKVKSKVKPRESPEKKSTAKKKPSPKISAVDKSAVEQSGVEKSNVGKSTARKSNVGKDENEKDDENDDDNSGRYGSTKMMASQEIIHSTKKTKDLMEEMRRKLKS